MKLSRHQNWYRSISAGLGIAVGMAAGTLRLEISPVICLHEAARPLDRITKDGAGAGSGCLKYDAEAPLLVGLAKAGVTGER